MTSDPELPRKQLIGELFYFVYISMVQSYRLILVVFCRYKCDLVACLIFLLMVRLVELFCSLLTYVSLMWKMTVFGFSRVELSRQIGVVSIVVESVQGNHMGNPNLLNRA